MIRTQLRDSELAVSKTYSDLTRRRICGAPTDDLETDLFELIEARDFMRARLKRLEEQ